MDLPTLGAWEREMHGRCTGDMEEIWGDMGRRRGDVVLGFEVGLLSSPGIRRRFCEMRLFLGDCVSSCEILRCRWRPHSPPCSPPCSGPRASAVCPL